MMCRRSGIRTNKCKALTVEEIHELVEKAGAAAKLAKDAGVDILEVHACGGYLLDQFISKLWNHREDEYGGCLENRLRFIREFYESIRAAVGPDYPVSVKFTPQHSMLRDAHWMMRAWKSSRFWIPGAFAISIWITAAMSVE